MGSPTPLVFGFPLLILAAACSSAPQPQPGGDSRLVEDCRRLVRAQPRQWVERIPPVRAHGLDASAPLRDALADHPAGPGAQAAVAVLGRLGDPRARPDLEELVRRRGPLASEAALALGRLPAPTSSALLLEVIGERQNGSVLRAAAAAAAIHLGRLEDCLDFVGAVLLAGSPAGREAGERFGLPRKVRWARERHMILMALRERTGRTFGLDMDAPWPRMERGVGALRRWVEGR